jgi:hypothetical protein
MAAKSCRSRFAPANVQSKYTRVAPGKSAFRREVTSWIGARSRLIAANPYAEASGRLVGLAVCRSATS